jgi:hypothetical protein
MARHISRCVVQVPARRFRRWVGALGGCSGSARLLGAQSNTKDDLPLRRKALEGQSCRGVGLPLQAVESIHPRHVSRAHHAVTIRTGVSQSLTDTPHFAGFPQVQIPCVRSLPPAEGATAEILAPGLWALQTRSWRWTGCTNGRPPGSNRQAEHRVLGVAARGRPRQRHVQSGLLRSRRAKMRIGCDWRVPSSCRRGA